MGRPLLQFAVIALCSVSTAQVWSPLPRFEKELGEGVQYTFGMHPKARYQFVDGNFRNAALVLSRIAMRSIPVYDNFGTLAMGRRWSQVHIDVGPADLSRVPASVAVFSANYLGSPTQCFSGPITWPTLVGPQRDPVRYYPVQMPLTTPYLHIGGGRRDFLIDFRTNGGVLANGVWGSAIGRTYFTDTYHVTSAQLGRARVWQSPGTGCVDTRSPAPGTRGLVHQTIERYAPNYPIPSYRDKLRVSNRTFRIGPGASFLNVVDFGVIRSGIPFGTRCEKLYLPVTAAALYFPAIADAQGIGPPNLLGLPSGFVRYDPSWKGLAVTTQSVWSDSVSKAAKLTTAETVGIPEFLFARDTDARRAVISHSTHGPNGFVSRRQTSNPIFRYN